MRRRERRPQTATFAGGRGAAAVVAVVVLLLVGWLILTRGPNQPEVGGSGPPACTDANVAHAVVAFYRALRHGQADEIAQALSDSSSFAEGGFMGMVVDGYQITSRDDVPETVGGIAAALTDVTLADVIVTLVSNQGRADFAFRIHDTDQESIGKGAVRCSDLKIITFNVPLPNVPLGSSILECGTEQDPSGDVRVCSNP